MHLSASGELLEQVDDRPGFTLCIFGRDRPGKRQRVRWLAIRDPGRRALLLAVGQLEDGEKPGGESSFTCALEVEMPIGTTREERLGAGTGKMHGEQNVIVAVDERDELGGSHRG